MFSDYFNIIILKIIFLKNIILIYFKIKNILNNNYYCTSKYPTSVHNKDETVDKKFPRLTKRS